MTDADFAQPCGAMETFAEQVPVDLAARHSEAIAAIVGQENISHDTYRRTRVSYGAGMIDALRLRSHRVENLPDLVVAPHNRAQIAQLVAYCEREEIPVYIFGAGSSVTRGLEAVKGGICLDMSIHMNRLVTFDEINQTITVEAGMTGPQLEALLNDAPRTLQAERRYTCGHFPQSFMHSSVGGWVVTRGAGQNSTYYGKIEDMVLQQTYVTPQGILTTPGYPRCATGPDFNQIMLGSEGCFGVLSEVTLKVRRYTPQNMRRFSYLFRNWHEAQAAVREMMQGEFGFPSVFRLSDPEETDVAMRIYHIHATAADSVLKTLGYQPMQRCLLLGSCDGEAAFTRRGASD